MNLQIKCVTSNTIEGVPIVTPPMPQLFMYYDYRCYHHDS